MNARSICTTLALCGSLGLPAQAELARGALEQASAALSKKDLAAAQTQLEKAFWANRLSSDRRAQRSLDRELQGLIRKLDPRLKRLFADQEKAVKALQAHLEHFRKQNNAHQVQRIESQLRSFHPLLVGTAPAAPGKTGLLEDWFKGGGTPYDDGVWRLDGGMAQSPIIPRDPRWNAILISKQACGTDFDLSLEVDFSNCLRAGICLGVRDAKPRPGAMTLFEFKAEPPSLIVSTLVGDKLEFVASVEAKAALPKPFCPLHIKVRGKRCEVQIGKQAAQGFDLPATLQGALGLYATTSKARPGPGRYRSFRVEQAK